MDRVPALSPNKSRETPLQNHIAEFNTHALVRCVQHSVSNRVTANEDKGEMIRRHDVDGEGTIVKNGKGDRSEASC